MNIYNHTCIDRTPYTYLIGWSQHNKWYYGVRYAKNCYPTELWVRYFTSSKHVRAFHEKHGEPNIIEVRKTFGDIGKAREYEHKVLRRVKVIYDDKWLNKSTSKSIPSMLGIPHTKEHNEKISLGQMGKIVSTTTRDKISKKLIGRKRSEETRTKISSTHKRLAQEGKSLFSNSEFHIKNNLKRVESGTHHFMTNPPSHKKITDGTFHLLGPSANQKMLLDGTHPSQIKVKCPHCQKTLGVSNAKRWHFDKCKSNNFLHIPEDT